MSEEQQEKVTSPPAEVLITETPPTPEPVPQPQTAKEPKSEIPAIPYSRFEAVNERMKAAEAKNAARELEDRQREEQEAIASGEYQKVIDELRPKADRVDVLEAALNELLQAEIENIPEDKRDLVPEGDVLTLLPWIAKLRFAGVFSAPAKPNPPNLDAGEGARQQSTISTEDQRWAKALGLTQEEAQE